MVQQTMADLIAAYELSVVEVSESEVLLKSKNYFIDIFADKEGVGLVYFDKMSRPVKGYNLFLYLVNSSFFRKARRRLKIMLSSLKISLLT